MTRQAHGAEARSGRWELVLATGNQHKVAEIKALLAAAGLAVTVDSLVSFASLPPVDEDGATFSENAAKKALYTGVLLGKPALADDSGLEVDALEGLPGVYSARYAGEAASDAENNQKLLAALQGVHGAERRARFRSVVALFLPEKGERGRGLWGPQALEELARFWKATLAQGGLRDLDRKLARDGAARSWMTPWGTVWLVAGACYGYITTEPRGEQGFGYDPLFYFPPLARTFGQVPLALKNQFSHRARALARAVKLLRQVTATAVSGPLGPAGLEGTSRARKN